MHVYAFDEKISIRPLKCWQNVISSVRGKMAHKGLNQIDYVGNKPKVTADGNGVPRLGA
jgi:hypothetical protein